MNAAIIDAYTTIKECIGYMKPWVQPAYRALLEIKRKNSPESPPQDSPRNRSRETTERKQPTNHTQRHANEDDRNKIEMTPLPFAPFTENELAVLTENLGNIEEFPPEKRKEVLVAHFRRLNMAGVRVDAEMPAD